MVSRTALSVSTVVGGIVLVCFLRPIRIVRVDGVPSSLYWTVRSWTADYPVSQDFASVWRVGNPNDRENFYRQHARLIRVWGFLRPFFASHGYALFAQKDPEDLFSECFPESGQATLGEIAFPFAERLYKDDEHAAFHFFVSSKLTEALRGLAKLTLLTRLPASGLRETRKGVMLSSSEAY